MKAEKKRWREEEEEEEDGDVAVGILKIKGVTKKRKKLWLKWPCLLLFISHYEPVFFLHGIFIPRSL